ncbi:EF-hand domain-containing protein [Sphingobium nicotianae]|uniref:EF-hand domain-containing protein n=1 Tax=Sphingobium nicotianae TaxID=2782607 RepID=A0A9X1AJW0_9SPHN|nr:EF-hand domain-containing protein [Sphingobium nicotianae]MBT2185844.1 hypothetical protein [Sphingobium nicotianae]
MVRILIAGSVLALAAPLAAQQTTGTAPADPAAAPSTPAQAAPAPAAGSGAVADAAAGAANNDFASYDADKSGQLDRSEFAAWYAAKHQSAADGKSSTKDVAVAFRKADADKSKTISEQELGHFLAG